MKRVPGDRAERRPARVKGMRRRASIVSVTVALCIDRRFDEITIKDIAAAAGVSCGTVHNHFAHKHEILGVFSRDIAASLAAAAEADARRGGSVRQDVFAVWRDLRRFVDDYRGIFGSLLHEWLNPDVARGARARDDFGLATLLGCVVERGRSAGQVDPAIDTAHLGALLADLMVAAVAHYCRTGDGEAADFAMAADLALLWHGVRAP